jgi:hypothetical protein
MGDENLLELEAEIGQPLVNAADFVSWIDDNGLSGLFISYQGAVASQRADRERFQNHASILWRADGSDFGFIRKGVAQEQLSSKKRRAVRPAAWRLKRICRYLPDLAGAEMGAVLLPESTECEPVVRT